MLAQITSVEVDTNVMCTEQGCDMQTEYLPTSANHADYCCNTTADELRYDNAFHAYPSFVT